MESFLENHKNSQILHHAYFFIEEKIDEAVASLKKYIAETLGLNISGNPDFYHRKFDNFTIDDARFIVENENRKAVLSNKKIFIIETDFITLEAQNALLKVFEEPTSGVHFFIFSPQDVLIPTLKSRLQVFWGSEVEENKKTGLLKMSMKERMDKVKDIVESIKDEEMTKQDAINLLNQIERDLYEEGVEKNKEKLKICEETRASLFDRGAPIKMILENLVLSI